jgi:glucose/arabinose dehydrogenase
MGGTGGKGGTGGSIDAGATGGMGGTGGMAGTGGSTGGTGGQARRASPATRPPAATPPALKRTTTITGFAGQPGQVVAVPGEVNAMYVIGHTTGNIQNVVDGKVSGTLLHVDVAGNGNGPEQGLLSMAFHPNFAQNHLFYVFYTAAGGGQITVDEFERTTNTTSMFKQNIHKHAGSNMYHNGGSIYFSPRDTKPLLYHSVGNAQSGGQSSSATALNGKVLRYDVSTKMGVPATGASGFTFAYGLRNPYRMSIDRLTGDIWIGEVSDGPGGSIFFISGSKGSVTNFGYSGNGEIGGGISGFQDGSAAIIGGVVYRGSKIPALCGRYFFGMHSNGAIRSFIQQNGQMSAASSTTRASACPARSARSARTARARSGCPAGATTRSTRSKPSTPPLLASKSRPERAGAGPSSSLVVLFFERVTEGVGVGPCSDRSSRAAPDLARESPQALRNCARARHPTPSASPVEAGGQEANGPGARLSAAWFGARRSEAKLERWNQLRIISCRRDRLKPASSARTSA